MSKSGTLTVLVRAVARRIAPSGRADRPTAAGRLVSGLVALIATASVACATNPPEILWTAQFPGDGSSSGYAVRPTRDGGFIAVGSTTDDEPEERAYVVKVASHGGLQWTSTLGGFTSREACDVAQLPDGGFAVLGTAASDSIVLVRTDSTGAVMWERLYGSGGPGAPANASALIPTSNGGFVIVAYTVVYGVVIRVDSTGSPLWQVVIDSADYGFDRSRLSVAAARDGGFVVGMMRSWPEDCPRLVKLTSTGEVEWDSSYAYTRGYTFYSVAATADGGYATTGTTYAQPAAGLKQQVFIAKTNASGELTTIKYFAATGRTTGYCVRQTSDGGYVIAGGDGPEEYGGGQLCIWRTSNTGVPLWSISHGLGGKAPDIAWRIECLPDGGYIVSGNVAHGEPDGELWRSAMFLMRLGPDPVLK